MNIVSSCCKASIVQGTKREYPLGDQYGINYKLGVCEACGKEADPVEVCAMCGETSTEFISVEGDHLCPFCFEDRLVEVETELKERTGLGA